MNKSLNYNYALYEILIYYTALMLYNLYTESTVKQPTRTIHIQLKQYESDQDGWIQIPQGTHKF